jgi:hypothetical protein
VKRDDGKLLDARRLFRVCGGPTCVPTQQRLCSEWLRDVDDRVPSVVLSAKDGSGADLVDVKVSVDGVGVATKLDGRAIDVDPGPHVFVFELADRTRVETKAVAEERGKGKVLTVRFGAASTAVSHPPSGNGAGPTDGATATTSPNADAGGTGSPLRTLGVVVGSAGIVGLAIGGVFGVAALSTKGSHCSNGLCDPGSASDADGKATVSTAAFVAGGVLLAGGVTLFVLSPRTAASVTVAPMVGSSAAGLQLAGIW